MIVLGKMVLIPFFACNILAPWIKHSSANHRIYLISKSYWKICLDRFHVNFYSVSIREQIFLKLYLFRILTKFALGGNPPSLLTHALNCHVQGTLVKWFISRTSCSIFWCYQKRSSNSKVDLYNIKRILRSITAIKKF